MLLLMRRMVGPTLSVLGVVMIGGCGRLMSLRESGCTKDGDCKGDRVCQAGQCVSPGGEVTSPVASSPPPNPSSANVGETLTLDESMWTVLDVQNLGTDLEPTSSFGTAKRTSGEFLQVHYKVTNNGRKQETLLETPKIVDKGGREFGHVEMESDYIPKASKAAILETLQPSADKEFYTVIEVPADATGLRIQLTGLGVLGQKRRVDVPAAAIAADRKSVV